MLPPLDYHLLTFSEDQIIPLPLPILRQVMPSEMHTIRSCGHFEIAEGAEASIDPISMGWIYNIEGIIIGIKAISC